MDRREVSGNWYSVSDDLLEQLEMKSEFQLLLVAVVVDLLIVHRRPHIDQIPCTHQLWKRRWEPVFHSAADAPSTVRVVVRQLATIHICSTVAVDQDCLDLLQIEALQGKRTVFLLDHKEDTIPRGPARQLMYEEGRVVDLVELNTVMTEDAVYTAIENVFTSILPDGESK